MTLFLMMVGNVYWMERLGLSIRKPVMRTDKANAGSNGVIDVSTGDQLLVDLLNVERPRP